jgi:hypothetical protein
VTCFEIAPTAGVPRLAQRRSASAATLFIGPLFFVPLTIIKNHALKYLVFILTL